MGLTAFGETVRPADSVHSQGTEGAADSAAATPCVLVVDDDADTREVLRMALEDERYRVIEATNGCEALSLLCLCNTPLVVILDQRMPGLLGTDVLDEALRFAHLPHTRAYILLTASPHRLPQPYNHQGFQRYIPVMGKPMDLDDLLDAVRRAFTRLYTGLSIKGTE